MKPSRSEISIGIDGHVLTGKFQGTRTTLANLLKALGPKLHERHLTVYSNSPREAAELLEVENVSYRDIGRSGPLGRITWKFPFLFFRDRISIGVFQYVSPIFGKNAVFIHDILPLSHGKLFSWKLRIKARALFSVSIRRAAIIFVVSKFTYKELIRLYPEVQYKTHIVLNGPSFSPDVYNLAARDQSEPYILVVGRIEKRKNIPLLVDAFRQANVMGLRLVIVGSFDSGFKYSLPRDSRLSIRSRVSDKELVELYRGASLFVYPSEAEGFGVPLLDATLFGLPTICSNRTAMPEVGGDLVTYFDPTDAGARDVLAKLISAHFLNNPIPRPSVEQRAMQSERYSWSRAADEFLRAVDSVF